MGTCKDCRRWGPPRRSEWGDCHMTFSDDNQGRTLTAAYAKVDAPEGVRHVIAWLWTHQTFGCTQFEAKPVRGAAQ